MKVTILTFLLFLSGMCLAESLYISGTVYPEVSFENSDSLTMTTNSEVLIEVSNSSGQTYRDLLQYKQIKRLDNNKVSKVIVYAP